MVTVTASLSARPDISKALNKNSTSLADTVLLEGDVLIGVELYKALSEARALGRHTVLLVTSEAGASAWQAMGFHSLAVTGGQAYLGGVLEEVLHRVYLAMTGLDQEAARATFPKQIEKRLDRHIKEFYEGPWVRAVRSKEMSLLQYMVTLENMHQYVRFTTRLLGRAVACSRTTPLRAHFARHLSGEVNHEILIERDLERLGRSADYLREARYANAPTRAFMVLEQSLVSFEQDPVLFAACPLAAEGITAHMDRQFLADLRACVARERPEVAEKATVFFASHIETDGGDDGHWAATMKLLHDNLPDERALGEMLTVLDLAGESFTRSFDSNVLDYGLFGRS